FYGKNPSFFAPRFRAAEMINVLKEAPPDLCISRKKERVPWGIDIPGEEDKVFYVWFDALLNYVTAPGLNRENGKMSVSGGVWPADLHLVGKEIYRFHTVIWPALLLALGLPLPARVFGHGWWTVEGEKMSKSRGNVVDPAGIVKEVGLDAFRTFLFRYVSFGQDGDFSRKSLIQHYQSDCANNLGNLFSRTLSMLQKYQEGRVESPGTTEGETIACRTEELVKNMDKDMMELAFTGVLEKIFSLCTDLNSFIEETAPWKMYKEKNERLKGVLYRLIDSLRQITLMLSPFMIEKTPVMKDLLKMETFEWGINKTPHSLLLGKPLILFPRLEE
ncbi:MAG TPA: class I tRNA ligase family protein, partial [bacterium]|nr:class I tRNA ligase family protein [bacterium]